MNITSNKPTGLFKFLLRAPIWLHNNGFGWLLGDRFLVLTHTGRKTKLQHQVVLEVVAHESEIGAYYVAAGWRDNADWFKNIKVNPDVLVKAGALKFKATATIVPLDEASVLFHTYAFRYRQAFRLLSHFMIGETLQPDKESCSRIAQTVPLLRLLPV